MSLEQSLGIYGPNILATFLSSIALALLGSQLASRSESLHAFVASQTASLGITTGLAFIILFTGTLEAFHWVPVVCALVLSSLIYFFAQKLCSRFRSKSSEILIGVFLFSLSLNFMITAALPHLESHFSASFMGDIATASYKSSHWLSVLSLVTASFFLIYFRELSLQSFWISSSNVNYYSVLKIVFYIACALLIVETTRIFGFLYTSACLTLTPLASSLVTRSLRGFVFLTVVLVSVSTTLGFALSLYSTKFSTSASIVCMQVLIPVFVVIVLRAGYKRDRNSLIRI